VASGALIVSIVSVLLAVLGFLVAIRSARASERSAGAAEGSATDARRSADAAESMDRRERQPNLSIDLEMPVQHPGDSVIYQVRNDGPEDLDAVTIYRPRPPDGIAYPIAVTGAGAGWADDEISLGSLRLTQIASFTLCCGAALVIPEFRARIECRAGKDTWALTRLLPPPRLVQMTAAEGASRRKILTSALLEIEHNVATLNGPDWHSIPMEEQHIREAERLLRDHAPERVGPIWDVVSGAASFSTWNNRSDTFRADEMEQRKGVLLALLSSAAPVLQNMVAALDTPQASGDKWKS
jgi:hypothetical protein